MEKVLVSGRGWITKVGNPGFRVNFMIRWANSWAFTGSLINARRLASGGDCCLDGKVFVGGEGYGTAYFTATEVL